MLKASSRVSLTITCLFAVYTGLHYYCRVVLSSSLRSPQTMTVVVTDGGGRTTQMALRVNIRQAAAPPIFTRTPGPNFKILENLTDNTIIARIKASSTLFVLYSGLLSIIIVM